MTLRPDLMPASAEAAKLTTERLWALRAPLDWSTIRLDNGTLYLSARILGRHQPDNLDRFADTVASYFDGRPGQPGDQVPHLDLSRPDREAVVWRTDGVWVELWHPYPPRPSAQPLGGTPCHDARRYQEAEDTR